MKILLLGHGNHGKDSLAKILKDNFNMDFTSSSEFACKKFIFAELKERYGYKTWQECFADRRSPEKRTLWFDLIKAYNKDNPSRLAEEILAENDIYVGMRSDTELDVCNSKNLFDFVFGIYDPNKPEEAKSSFDIDFWRQCDAVFPTAESPEKLEKRVVKVFKNLLCE